MRSRPWCRALVCLSLAFFAPRARAQDVLNGDFERASGINPVLPWGWRISGSSTMAYIERQCAALGVRGVSSHGSCALHFAPTGAGAMGQGIFALRELAASSLAGHRIDATMSVRTDAGPREGFDAWLRIATSDGLADSIPLIGNASQPSPGWNTWKATTVARKTAAKLWVVMQFRGGSHVWVDNVQLTVDGASLDAALALSNPAREELARLRRHVMPLSTADPSVALADVESLGRLFGTAPIIVVGEGTHGTSEFFQLRHRILRYLVERRGFHALVLEANMAATRAVDEYLRTGRGDPRSLPALLGFRNWETEETLAMLDWMREYNVSRRGTIRVFGFDSQALEGAPDSVVAYLRDVSPASAAAVAHEYDLIASVQARATTPWDPIDANSAARFLDAARRARVLVERALRQPHSIADADRERWARKYADLLVQAGLQRRAVYSDAEVRDSLMAANVEWIRDYLGDRSKVVIGAHHFHVERAPNTFGHFLTRRYGAANVRILGTVTFEGDYLANGGLGVQSYPAYPAADGSIEKVLRQFDTPFLAFDLRGASADRNVTWIRQPREIRQIGTVAREPGFEAFELARRFDGLLFVARSNAARPLARPIGNPPR